MELEIRPGSFTFLNRLTSANWKDNLRDRKKDSDAQASPRTNKVGKGIFAAIRINRLQIIIRNLIDSDILFFGNTFRNVVCSSKITNFSDQPRVGSMK